MNENFNIDGFIPVIPLKNVVAVPRSVIPVVVGRDFSIRAVEYALEHGKEVFVTAQKAFETKLPGENDIFHFGTSALVLQASRMPNGTLKIFIEGISRAKAVEIKETEAGFLCAKIERIESQISADETETEGLWRTLYDLFKNYVELTQRVPHDILTLFKEIDLDFITDTVSINMQMSLEDRQRLLEMVDCSGRAEFLIQLIKREIEIFKTEQKIRKRVQNQVEKNQKDYYLQEQMRAIQRELGKDGQTQEIEELKKKAKKIELSKEAREKVELELNRLDQMQSTSPEANVSRNYVEWILSLPWGTASKDRISIGDAEKILDASHASMKKPKERILEFIATKKFAGEALKRSPIICLAGPPGVGKTTLARSIAESLGREFLRISLGGVRDEAEIRGHRRTYIGAMPGKIIQVMKKSGTTNPVILLDEIDKMSMDFRGDPASALLEVLDPEFNNAFVDHYLEVEYDLSKVTFIATANVVDSVPYPLLDRMEIITLSGYTADEKIKITKNFLLPKLIKEHALSNEQFSLNDVVIRKIIEEYTKEAGVRQLERVLAKVIRKSIQALLDNSKLKKVTVNIEKIEQWLGSPKFKKPELSNEKKVGVATGLAWTEVGGDILEVEISILKGKGSLSLTGQLGDVMKESAEAALTYVRSRAKELGLKENFYSNCDIHIHVPEGAIPKDGPSAGITMTVALISALTKEPIKAGLAMTGEVTLRGRVLPVGGLKEKLLAATRFGMNTVIVPKENSSDVKEFEKELDTSLKVIYADSMDSVIKEAFEKFRTSHKKHTPAVRDRAKSSISQHQ